MWKYLPCRGSFAWPLTKQLPEFIWCKSTTRGRFISDFPLPPFVNGKASLWIFHEHSTSTTILLKIPKWILKILLHTQECKSLGLPLFQKGPSPQNLSVIHRHFRRHFEYNAWLLQLKPVQTVRQSRVAWNQQNWCTYTVPMEMYSMHYLYLDLTVTPDTLHNLNWPAMKRTYYCSYQAKRNSTPFCSTPLCIKSTSTVLKIQEFVSTTLLFESKFFRVVTPLYLVSFTAGFLHGWTHRPWRQRR